MKENFNKFELPPQKDHEYVESKRICKGRFNIFHVAAIDDKDKDNYFFGSLIAFSVTFFLGVIGLFLLLFKIQIILGIFLICLPIFGFATFCVGIRYLLHAKKIYLSGKKYIVKIDYDSLGSVCVLCANGKTTERDTLGIRIPFNENAAIIYSEEFDEFLFLNSKENYTAQKECLDDLKNEDALIDEYLTKIHNGSINTNIDGTYKIRTLYATDKKRVHLLSRFIICLALIILLAVGIVLLNLVFNNLIPNSIIVALTVVFSFFLLLVITAFVFGVKSFFLIKAKLNGADLHFAKIIETKSKTVVHGRDDSEWVKTYYSFVYQLETKAGILIRTFEPCYNLDEKDEIKKMITFPLLYNAKHDVAFYFNASNCRTLINSMHEMGKKY